MVSFRTRFVYLSCVLAGLARLRFTQGSLLNKPLVVCKLQPMHSKRGSKFKAKTSGELLNFKTQRAVGTVSKRSRSVRDLKVRQRYGTWQAIRRIPQDRPQTEHGVRPSVRPLPKVPRLKFKSYLRSVQSSVLSFNVHAVVCYTCWPHDARRLQRF